MTDLLGALHEQDLAGQFEAVRSLTEELAAPLSPEDQTVQSMPDVSPTKWHRAHTSWFFETFLLAPNLRGYRTFDPTFGFLFNSYYEGVGPRHPRAERGLLSRPGVKEIARYRAHVDEAMTGFLDTHLDDEVGFLVELGNHHEQQHQELLLMDIKHVLWCNPTMPAYRDLRPPTAASTPSTPSTSSNPSAPSVTSALSALSALSAPAARPLSPGSDPRSGPSPTGHPTWTANAGGLVGIGHDGPGFAFDNEFPRHTVHLEAFLLRDQLVTCGEWLEFIADHGYHRADLWLSDGWATVQAERWEGPLYWFQADGEWQEFALSGPVRIDPDRPVCHVSYYEADAFARWAGARLPTEDEWETVAASEAEPADTTQPRLQAPNFLDLEVLRPTAPRPGRRPSLLGDVWQWTSSAYSPYPRFTPARGAVGEYNGKFMVNQYVLRGGSFGSPAGHVRPTYRNFFPPGSRWPFCGLRLARSA